MTPPLIIQTFTVPISLRFVAGQVAFWRQHNFEVHFLTADGPEIAQFVTQNNAIHTVLPFNRSFSLLNAGQCLWLLIRYFLKHKPTIVHGNTPKAALLTMIAAWITKVPVRIYEMHGLPLQTASPVLYPFLWFIEKLTCTLSTSVMSVSPSLREVAIQKKVVCSSKIAVNHNGSCNGIDAEKVFNPSLISPDITQRLRTQLSISKTDPVVGFVGRLTFEKGIRELYVAWQEIKIRFPQAKLLIVGEVDERKKLPINWIEKLRNDSSIHLVGQVENVADYYALIDCLVLPSYREGLGNVVLEAAAMQKPAIVAHVTGLENTIIEDKTGLFCKTQSAHSLAEQILYYLNNQQIVEKHGLEAQNRVKHDFKPIDVWTQKLIQYKTQIALQS